MKIAYITHDTPDVFYRVGQYMPYVKDAGITAQIFRTPSGFPGRMRTFGKLKAYDAVIIQRRLFNPFWLYMIRSNAGNIILDMDDAIMFRDDEDNPYSSTRMKRFRSMVNACSSVIAGSTYLRDTTLEVCPGSVVHVIPTAIDTDAYESKVHSEKPDVVIGWIGSSSTIRYLEMLRPVFRRLLVENPAIRIKVVSNGFPDWDFIEKKVWVREDENRDILGMDIGVMPLDDTPWTRGKCGFKLIQYMASGLPVVASPVGANNDIVAVNETGYLAGTEDDWLGCLRALIADWGARKAFGARGRTRAERLFSVRANAAKYIRAIGEGVS